MVKETSDIMDKITKLEIEIYKLEMKRKRNLNYKNIIELELAIKTILKKYGV